jgi:hypothetical protein
MRKWAGALAVAGLLAGAPPAYSAARVDLGPGRYPSMVIDPGGTAHIVFESAGGATYCRLPRGARACDARLGLPLEGSFDPPRIFRRASDGALLVAQADDRDLDDDRAFGTLYVSASFDGGATFSPPAMVRSGTYDFDNFALSADGGALFSLQDTTDGLVFRISPLAGADPRTLLLEPRSDSASESALVKLSGGRVLALANTLGTTRWHVFTGGDVLDGAAWTKHGTLRHMGDVRLATGPRGTFLLDHRSLERQRVGRAAPFGLRSLDSKRLRWRKARPAGADNAVFGTEALFEDPAGRLHVAGTSFNAERGASCLLYTRTATKKSWFGRTTMLLRTRNDDRAPHGPVLAADATGRGLVAWYDERGTGATGHVWVMRLRQQHGAYRPIRNPSKRKNCGSV